MCGEKKDTAGRARVKGRRGLKEEMADKDNNNRVYHSDNACKKKLKVILKLPKGFADSEHPRLQQPPLPSYPRASASPSGKPNLLRSEPTATPDALLQRPAALVSEAPRRGASASVQAVKRKLDAFGEGLVTDSVESTRRDSRTVTTAADSEALPSDEGKFTPTIYFKKPAHKKVEDIGFDLEGNDACEGSSEDLNKASLPSRKVLEALLDKLQKKDTYQVFAEPVDASLIPDYYNIIKDPMDFATVRKKLSEGKYSTLELFKKDVFQISINAMRYNGPKTIYYKQARAILDSARKALSLVTGSNCYGEAAQKGSKFKLLGSRKSWKQSASVGNRVELVRPDHISGATLATDDGQRYGFGAQKGVGLYKSSALEKSSGLCSAALGHLHKKDVNSSSLDYKTSPALDGIGKFMERDYRRPPPVERYRRSSYKPRNSLSRAQESFPLGLSGDHCQLVPVGGQQDHAYARSLARFGVTLKVPAWKIVAKRLQNLSPSPNILFGEGWIQQQEGVSSQHNIPLDAVPIEKVSAAVSLQSKISESASSMKNVEPPKSLAVNQLAHQSCQNAVYSSTRSSTVPHVSTVDCPVPSSVTLANTQLNSPLVDVETVPIWEQVMHKAIQSGQHVSQEHLNAQGLIKPNLEGSTLRNSSKGHLDAKIIKTGLLSKGLSECNSNNVLSHAESSNSVHAVVRGTSIGANLSENVSARTSQAVSSRSGQQATHGHSNVQRPFKPNVVESSFYNSSKGFADAKLSRSMGMGLVEKGSRDYISKDAIGRPEMPSTVYGIVKETSVGGSFSESASLTTSALSQDSRQDHSIRSLQCQSGGKENAFSKSMHFPRLGSFSINVPATSFSKQNIQNPGQPQSDTVSNESEHTSVALREGSMQTLFQDLNSQIELKPSQFEEKTGLQNRSQTSPSPAISALAPVTLLRESENTGFQVIKLGQCRAHLPSNYSKLQFPSSTFLPFPSETALQQTSSSARPLPPDLNVCLQSPTTP